MDKIIKSLLNKETKVYVIDYQAYVVRFLRFLFILYTIFLSQQLLFGSERFLARDILISNRDLYINLVPFNSIALYINHFHYFNLWDWIINIFGNVLIFVPIGILMPCISSKYKSFLFTFGTGLTMSVTIEVAQYYLCLGVFDVDDMILNVFGVVLGFIFYKIIKKIRPTLT